MSELAQKSLENDHDLNDLRDKYTLPDTSAAILEKIKNDIDKGHGIHKGGFIDNDSIPLFKVGPGNRTAKELSAFDGIARLSFTHDGADPVVESKNPLLSGLSLEEARDAAFGGLTLGSSLDGSDTKMDFIVLDDMSPNPDRDTSQDKRGILEKSMFLANGATNPSVVESMSTYTKGEDDTALNKLESFTMTRREASPAEVVAYYETKRQQQ
jgi:hypothetical protein